jgi:hypothetical protein
MVSPSVTKAVAANVWVNPIFDKLVVAKPAQLSALRN